MPASSSNNNNQISTSLRAEIGETGISFENVAREWRCKVRDIIHVCIASFTVTILVGLMHGG